MQFDHEKLDVYKVSLEFVSFVADIVNGLKGNQRNVRDQLIRSSQSIPLNIAESSGKRSIRDRRRFLEIARGSAMESAASLDVLVCLGACSSEQIQPGKTLLIRIVSMLSRMTEERESFVRETPGEYGDGDEHEYEHEHGDEYEYEHEHEHGDRDGDEHGDGDGDV